MTYTFDITPFIVGAIAIIGGVITAYLIPWLKTKIGAEKLTQLLDFSRAAVNAAEMMAKAMGWSATDKFNYCLEQVTKVLADHKIVFDEEAVKVAIENAVKEMKDDGLELKKEA